MAEMNWRFRTKQDWMANMSNIWNMDGSEMFSWHTGSVLMHDGVVEGGTGELNKEEEETEAHKKRNSTEQRKKRKPLQKTQKNVKRAGEKRRF